MKKEIWLLAYSYRPNGDAPANRMFSFAKHFDSLGYKVNVITCAKTNSIETNGNITVYRLKNTFHYKKRSYINRLLDGYVFRNKTKSMIAKHKKEIKDSFFMVTSPELIPCIAGLKAKRYGAKLIFDVRDIWPEVAIEMGSFGTKSFPAKFFRNMSHKLYKEADYVITVSRRKYDYLSKINNGFIANKCHYIGNGFDLDSLDAKFNPDVLNGIDLTNKFVVSYVGNIGRAQQLQHLLNFANENKNSDYLFIIAGKGAELDNLKNFKACNHLDNVVFTGEESKEDAISITKLSSLSYISLKSDKMVDSVPTKLFESLGLGVPVLLVAKGESADILAEAKLGISIKPSELYELNSAFNKIRTDYNNILINKEHCMDLIKNNYSRQKFNCLLSSLLEK